MNQPAPMATDLRLNTTMLTGATVFQTRKVRLEWTRQDRIRIIDLESPQEQVLADFAPQEVAKASYVGGVYGSQQSTLTLRTVSGHKFRLMIDDAVVSPQPWESVEQYNARVARDGMPSATWWTERLASFGANAKHIGAGKIWLWGVGGGVALVAVIVVIAAIAAAFG
ncbi:hypothetical protein EXU48_08105 [Occultella glacieicola]|uniref:Uncharacterized protein n=1 Tax=Occultella glacieicola TaxID=2518684 RepID=A0ABY2E7R0_9MICO|nr:hypothetical protein [Occultella glacieicola]TDE94752.1 hypothetical protein EXU48_08105 [Occultella glacieicola]